MSNQLQKALIVFGGGLLLFWLLKPGKKVAGKSKQPDIKTLRMNGTKALYAYMAAVKAGESSTDLAEMNRVFEKDYSVRVYYKNSDKNFFSLIPKVSDFNFYFIF